MFRNDLAVTLRNLARHAGLTALLMAWATVLGHAGRVAPANPIRALRHE